MFQELQRCLDSYQRTITATREARTTAQRIASDPAYAARRQARTEHETRLEHHRQVSEQLDWELHGMTPTMRRLQQQAEIRQWAQEAKQ